MARAALRKTTGESKSAKCVACGQKELGGLADHYYISSADCDALEFGKMIRAHWSIENNLHWSLDVFFREDACHARKDNFPLNMTVMRKVALPLLKAVPMTRKRISMRRRMFTAALDPNFLRQILFGS